MRTSWILSEPHETEMNHYKKRQNLSAPYHIICFEQVTMGANISLSNDRRGVVERTECMITVASFG